MAEEIFLPLSFDTSGLSSELDSMQSSIKNLSAESKKFGDTGENAAKGVSDAMDKGKESTERATTSTKTSTEAQREHGSAILNNIKNYRVFGVSINSITKNVKAAQAALIGMTAATKGGAVALRVFRAALISTGIGAIVVAVGSLVSYFTRFQPAIDAVNIGMAALGAIFDNILDTIGRLGGALVKVFKGDFSGALEEAKGAANDLYSNIENGVQQAVRAQRLEIQLRQQQIEDTITLAEANRDLQEARRDAEDETLPRDERIEAIDIAFQKEQEIFELKKNQLQTELEIIQAKNAAAVSTDKDLQAEADARAALIKLEEQSAQTQRSLLRVRTRLDREAERERMAAIKERNDAIQKYEDSIDNIREKLEDFRIGNLQGSERVKAERDRALAEIEALETELKAQAKAAGKAYDDSFVEALRGQVRREAEEELTEITRQANAERIESFFNMVNKRISERKSEIDQTEELALLEVELLQESTNELLSLEEFKEKRRLEIQRKAYEDRLELLVAQFGEDSPEVQLVETQIAIINQKIAKILDVDEDGFQGVQDKFNAFLQDTLNLDEDQLMQFKDAISSLANDIGSLITSATDRQIEENERLLDSIHERRQAVEGELEAELEAQEKGYANNVESKRKELEQIAAQEQAAEQRQAELQQKAAKRQLAADIATQSSALATTAINLIKGFSNIPLGLGIPLALALVAKVFTTFKSLKAQAAEIGSESLSEGGPVSQSLNGRSDKGGQRGHRVEGSNLRLGGDEFVIRSEISQRERPFIEAFNKDGWKSVPMSLLPDSLGGRVVGTGVNANDMLVRDAIKNQTREMIKHADGKADYIPLPDGYIERKGDKRKRVRLPEYSR